MRRFHLIEFHDQPWFPSSIRDYVTDALQFGFNFFNIYEPVTPVLQRVIDRTRSQTIIDMCSGGGGPWLDLVRRLEPDASQNHTSLRICLSDRYPNLEAFEKAEAASGGRIGFYPQVVDATSVPREIKGIRTMFSTFHHFLPQQARAILQDAVDAREGIGLFEAARRAPATIVLVFVFVFAIFVCTPWIRPFRWSRLFWTYLIPVIPFDLLFDGVVSCLRSYRPQELRELVAGLNAGEYRWEIGELSTGMSPITYLAGYPTPSAKASD
jgi:hypothetical protein